MTGQFEFKATEAQKLRLAETFLRVAREAMRDTPTDRDAITDFRAAMSECYKAEFPNSFRLVPTFSAPDDVPLLLRILDNIQAVAEAEAQRRNVEREA